MAKLAELAELAELITRWDSNEGKPYKGGLIDWSAYMGSGDEPPAEPPLGCMCAQGQVLHLLGGWEPRRLRDTAQVDADAATAKLLNISVAHAILLRNVNDKADGAPSIVLTDPEKVLGGEASRLLDFWWHLDQMTHEQWAAARAAAWAAAGDAASDAASEIQGAELLRERGKNFFFLPMFGFDSPGAIPPRPSNYGQAA